MRVSERGRERELENERETSVVSDPYQLKMLMRRNA